jgi:DegV family protein with EDD domain
MTIKIVTDSLCDLPLAVALSHGITVVPAYINVNGQSYLDGIELTRENFYESLPGYDPLPTTSVPGMDVFLQTYHRLAAEGVSDIISIHVASTLSNMADVATLAAKEIQITSAGQVAVHIVDSGQLSLGQGYMALAAAEAAAAGAEINEVLALIRNLMPRTYVFAALDTMEYLRRSGRVSRLVAGVGNLLQIKPIIIVHEGKIAMERARTMRGAIQRLLERLNGLGRFDQLSMVHSNDLCRVEELRASIQHLFPPGKPSYCVEVTPTIGTHIGPGAVGVVCVQAA